MLIALVKVLISLLTKSHDPPSNAVPEGFERGLGFRVYIGFRAYIGFKGFGVYPEAPKRVLGFLREGLGFGGYSLGSDDEGPGALG